MQRRSAPFPSERLGKQNLLALLEHRTALDVHVEEVHLLVPLGDGACLVNPQNGVLYFAGVGPWFVDADMDRQPLSTGFLLQAENEGALVDWFDQADGLLGRCGNVVGCFGEEQGLLLGRWRMLSASDLRPIFPPRP